ncbi:MAG: hypothetical protein FJ144_04490 [Deltaproteobacteria bacterium]|nr:hypothetical protein [Deltaproteobacteria bacterium]
MGSTPKGRATGPGVLLTQLLAVHATSEMWVWAAYGKFGTQVGIWADLLGLWPPLDPRPGYVVALALSAVAALAFVPGRARIAAGLQTALMCAIAVYFFPNVPNHFIAFTMGLGLCAFCDPERETDLLLLGLRSVAALIFFGAGIQKILHGTYFHGAIFGFMVAEGPNFRETLKYLLPADEMARLQAARGRGPFFLSSWLGIFAANLSWILEILLPAGLLIRATRVGAAIAAVLFVVVIQLSAREVFFAGFMVPLLLLWVSPAAAVRSLPVVYFVDAYLVLAGFGLFPYFAAI